MIFLPRQALHFPPSGVIYPSPLQVSQFFWTCWYIPGPIWYIFITKKIPERRVLFLYMLSISLLFILLFLCKFRSILFSRVESWELHHCMLAIGWPLVLFLWLWLFAVLCEQVHVNLHRKTCSLDRCHRTEDLLFHIYHRFFFFQGLIEFHMLMKFLWTQ